MKLKKWKIEDANGNSISVVAPSVTQAKKQYKQMLPTNTRIVRVTDEGEAKQPKRVRLPMPGEDDDSPKFKPIETIRNKGVKDEPNKPCKCGSGKKFKKCCARKGR